MSEGGVQLRTRCEFGSFLDNLISNLVETDHILYFMTNAPGVVTSNCSWSVLSASR